MVPPSKVQCAVPPGGCLPGQTQACTTGLGGACDNGQMGVCLQTGTLVCDAGASASRPGWLGNAPRMSGSYTSAHRLNATLLQAMTTRTTHSQSPAAR